jgi:succinate dehydrogenase/fumarate reductase flavoprotein subunit
MSSIDKEENRISRRQFIKAAAIGSAAVAGAGVLASCGPTQAATSNLPAKWDKEVDVVIVGFGGAGAVAAITAYDAKAKVLILEKAPQGQEGGNTRVSGNMWFSPTPADQAVTYFNALSGPFTAPPAMVQVWAEEMGKVNDFVTAIGGEVGELNIFNPEFPELAGSECAKTYAAPTSMQSKLWKVLKSAVDDRQIEVLYGTPAKQLVQNPDTKEILGVMADQSGTTIAIKAKKAVIMTCGGFENNQQMIRDYLHLETGYPKGTPYNTGDGVEMAIAVGADLWHMDNMAGPDFNFKAPDFDYAFGYTISPSPKSWMMVSADNKRFIDAKAGTRHGKVLLHGQWVPNPVPMPVHMIFDEKVRTNGPLYYNQPMFCWYSILETYKWSQDNMTEISKGWIAQANSIQELAQKINRDPAALDATVSEYNQACAAGADPMYGTTAENLVAIDTPPYYAMEMFPTFTNTQGGARRNEKAQVLDTQGSPIPRLYSAGEFGSIYGNLYNGGGNNGESLAFGQVAARNAVAETAWG